jgi:hypothetical protein
MISMKDIFDLQVSQDVISRIGNLTPITQPMWGKMNVSQMLAHCNVTYELVYTEKHKSPNFLVKSLLKLFVKPIVVGPKPYKKSSQTAPVFLIHDERDFETEKKRLIEYVNKVQQEGRSTFEGRIYSSFGVLTAEEWNVLFYKHLDHHLSQFGC